LEGNHTFPPLGNCNAERILKGSINAIGASGAALGPTGQAFRASAIKLVVSAIILWNTVYLSRAVDQLRAEGHDLPDEILRHVSPQIWEHITLIGSYDWNHQDLPPSGAFRPLRGSPPETRAAA